MTVPATRKEARWAYIGTDSADRVRALSNPIRPESMIHRLTNEMTLLCFHQQRRSTDHSYSRAVYCGTVPPDLFDQFFNSLSGYRGAYFQSIERGETVNRQILDALSPQLRRFAADQQSDSPNDWLMSSLAQPSAKLWLAEDALDLCENCRGEWSSSYLSDLHIVNGRWESAQHLHVRWGCQAPRLTKIRVFGGFIDGAGQEWIADHKKRRAEEIWQHGWS